VQRSHALPERFGIGGAMGIAEHDLPDDLVSLATSAPTRVLIVEDDADVAGPLVHALEAEGYAVSWVDSGERALDHLDRRAVDLTIVDLGLPDMDGLDVVSRARKSGYSGAIMISSARGAELDRVVGLDNGADEYLAKPVGLAEFRARARALVRRAGRAAEAPAPASGPMLRIDAESRRAHVDEVQLELRPREFDLLRVLNRHHGHVVPRDQLMTEVWRPGWYGSPKTLDVTIAKVRVKLAEAGVTDRIVAVRGVGFRMEPAPPA
jgi:DNA-binding response OmpR family regulator